VSCQQKKHTQKRIFFHITRFEYCLSEKEAYEIIRDCIVYALLYESKLLVVFHTKFCVSTWTDTHSSVMFVSLGRTLPNCRHRIVSPKMHGFTLDNIIHRV